MALEIEDDNFSTDVIWCDGRETYLQTRAVCKVVASGDELKRVLLITGLPQYGSAMKFYGDTARYIVGNFFN